MYVQYAVIINCDVNNIVKFQIDAATKTMPEIGSINTMFLVRITELLAHGNGCK